MDKQLALEAGFNYLQQNEVQLAKKIFEETLEGGYEEDAAYFGLGCCYLLDGDPNEGIKYFEKSIEITPTAESYFNLGVIYMKSSTTKAEECFKTAIELDPDHYTSYINLGILLRKDGRLSEAKHCYKKVIEIGKEKIIAYYNLAIVLHDIGEDEESEKIYRKVLELDPAHSQAYVGLGILLVSLGSYDEAEELYNKAIELDANNANAYINYGVLLVHKQFLKEGEYYYRKAITIDPSHPDAYFNLGMLYEKRRLPVIAEIYYNKAIEVDASYALAYAALGTSAFKKDQLDDAVAYLKKAIELNPRHASTYSNLGNILMHKGDIFSSEEYSRKALDLDPKHSIAYCNLGQLYLKYKNQVNKAKAFFEKAVETDDLNAAAYSGLGDVEIIRSNPQKAYEYHSYAATLANNPKEIYAVLFKYAVEINPNKDKHFYRFIYLSFLDNRFTHVLEALMFAENIDAAMLINRIVSSIDILKWDVFASFFDLIQRSIDRTYLFRCLIQSWRKENKYPYSNWLSTAIINYYTGDPIEAFRIFDFEIECNDLELDLIGHYYFCLSATSFLEEERSVFSEALKQAENTLKNTAITETEKYYAALIYYLNGWFEKSIYILEELFPKFIPAGYKLIEIYEALHLKEMLASNQIEDSEGLKSPKAIKTLRELRLNQHTSSWYRFGLEAITPSHEEDKFLGDIMPVIHFMEVQNVVAEVFVKPLDIRSAFFNLIILDSSDTKKENLLLKDQAAKAWQQVIEQEIDPEELEDTFNGYKNFKSPQRQLGELIHLGAKAELFDIKSKHRNSTRFNFKLYLALNYRLYKEGYIDGIISDYINDYVYVCMDALPVFKESDAKTYFLNSVRDNFLQDRIPYIGYVQNIHELIKLIRKDKIGETSPIISYEDFLKLYNSAANDS